MGVPKTTLILSLLLGGVFAQLEREVLFLMKYGYLEGRENITTALLTDVGFKMEIARAVRDFQAFVPGLNITGEVDINTEHQMTIPRCGVKDIVGHGAKTRRKR